MMCCGLEAFSVENTYDVKRLMSSVLRKKRTNRIRKHPSMCVDAMLTATIRLLKNDEQLILQAESRCRKRPNQSTMDASSEPPKRKSRWDVRVKCKKTNNCKKEVDQELEDMLGMNQFFQRLKGVSSQSSNASCSSGSESGNGPKQGS